VFAGLTCGYVAVVHAKAYRCHCILLVHCTIVQIGSWSIRIACSRNYEKVSWNRGNTFFSLHRCTVGHASGDWGVDVNICSHFIIPLK
jgi:hypothetical protein